MEIPQDEKPKRKRIPYPGKPPLTAEPVMVDELAFVANRGSVKARKSCEAIETVKLEFWHDKHYHDRQQHGDDDGPRDGIEPEVVEDLVKRAMKHLFLYSAAFSKFRFINFEDNPEPVAKVLIMEDHNGQMLNVVIEAYFVELNKYEVTVKTAMCTNGFRIGDGQYVIEIDGDRSTLKKKENNRLKEIWSF